MKLLRLPVPVLAGLIMCGFASAQNTANQYPFAAGKIENLDSVTKQIIVKTAQGNRDFTVTNATYLIAGGAKITLDKLKVGDPVKLNYFTNQTGQAIIRRLKIVPLSIDDSPFQDAFAGFGLPKIIPHNTGDAP